MKTMWSRRLLQRLQQGIEGRVGNLVRFVEDVNLVAVARRAIACGVAQFANLIDAAIGRRVDLDHIDRVAGANLGAGIADAAGFRRGRSAEPISFRQFRRHRQDARDGRLADAAMPAENVSVRDASLGQRIYQGARDVVLPGDIGEKLGTVFAGEYQVCHGIRIRRGRCVQPHQIVSPGGRVAPWPCGNRPRSCRRSPQHSISNQRLIKRRRRNHNAEISL